MNSYFFEYTDTYGGETNYTWVNRFSVKANNLRGALIKVSREIGLQKRLKLAYNSGDSARWDIKNSCTCLLYQDIEDISQYFHVKFIE